MPLPESTIEANAARDKVLESLKIVAGPCYIHPSRPFCNCPTAIRNLPRLDHNTNKRVWYCLTLEALLLDKQHAWNYNGDKASHDAFVAAEGVTPKHFIKDHLQNSFLPSQALAPSGKLSDTIKATLDLWLARNKQWRELYGDRPTAARQWAPDEYGGGVPIRDRRLDAASARVGDIAVERVTLPAAIRVMGHGEHKFQVVFTKTEPGDGAGVTPYGVTVCEVEWCHAECEVGQAWLERNLQRVARNALAELLQREG
ncbi:hypothetical protein HII31_02801 [Pseudocercospora fuligena]|uniref:Uncharacterized protein n=1 Tax=Pseudocercospora fuligena TaxID=685502 RepID=A0A8H6RTF9_9PEZI|nr:hypothetical protein HII31_02801 [Pseudocercospora fuligena]